METALLPAIRQYLEKAEQEFGHIAPARKVALQQIAEGIRQLLNTTGHAPLIYICTHNSRRSHMGQYWALAAAAYYHIEGITSYSGGTETTAFHPNASKALQEAGFDIRWMNVVYATNKPPVAAYSKKYTDAPNPTSDFIAVMTCSHADDNCPVVTGAYLKVTTPYDDPKEGDGTPEQDQLYKERCMQIATEVLYTFSLV